MQEKCVRWTTRVVPGIYEDMKRRKMVIRQEKKYKGGEERNVAKTWKEIKDRKKKE